MPRQHPANTVSPAFAGMAIRSRYATPPSVNNSSPRVKARNRTDSKSKSRKSQIKYQSSGRPGRKERRDNSSKLSRETTERPRMRVSHSRRYSAVRPYCLSNSLLHDKGYLPAGDMAVGRQ